MITSKESWSNQFGQTLELSLGDEGWVIRLMEKATFKELGKTVLGFIHPTKAHEALLQMVRKERPLPSNYGEPAK